MYSHESVDIISFLIIYEAFGYLLLMQICSTEVLWTEMDLSEMLCY